MKVTIIRQMISVILTVKDNITERMQEEQQYYRIIEPDDFLVHNVDTRECHQVLVVLLWD
jgi:hypothetical protein